MTDEPLNLLEAGKKRQRIAVFASLTPKQVESLARRFPRFLGKPSSKGCREWTGAVVSKTPNRNYGSVGVRKRVTVLAHRAAYFLHYGPFDETLNVLHRCDNPPCCEWSHLFLGDQSVNMRDVSTKGRWGERRGENNPFAKLTEADVRELRRLHAEGVAYRELARRFVVDRTAIKHAVTGVTWSHIV